MISLLINLSIIINLYKWNNLPYSNYVITDESFIELNQNIGDIMIFYSKSKNETIKIEMNTNISENEFIEYVSSVILKLRNSKNEINDEKINNGIEKIMSILDNWINILYAH
jgi:hypothetical protein